MTNRYKVKYYNNYNKEEKAINLYKNNKLIDTFYIKNKTDILSIDYPDVIKNLVLSCYLRGLKADATRKKENDEKFTNLDFMNEPLTEYDLKILFKKHGLDGLLERCSIWNKKIGRDYDYSKIIKKITEGGN